MSSMKNMLMNELFDRIEELQYLHDGIRIDAEEMFDDNFTKYFMKYNSIIREQIEEIEELVIGYEMDYADLGSSD